MILKTQHHGTLLTTSDTLATAESYQHDLPLGTAAGCRPWRRSTRPPFPAQVQAWAGKGTID